MSKVAYGVYTYTINVSPSSKVGVAEFNGTKISIPKSPAALDRTDPKVFYFKNLKNETRILVFETKYVNKSAVNGVVSVYDEELNQIVGPTETDKLVNLYAITDSVDLGDQYDYIYGIDYDNHKIVRIKICAGSTLEFGTEYNDFKPTAGKGYGVDVITDGTSVYGLFVSAKDVWKGDYDSYSLIRLDKNLGNAVRLDVSGEKNPFSIDLYNNELYVTLVGGMQKYGSTNGANSKIQKVSAAFTAASKMKTLLVGGDTAVLGDFRALSITAAGEAYIMTGRLESDAATFSGAVYYVAAGKLANAAGGKITSIVDTENNPPHKFDKAPGWQWGLFYSAADKALWAAQGDAIGVYKCVKQSVKLKSAADITALAGSDKYHLNSVALLTAAGTVKGYTAPEFASVSAEARLAKERLLKLFAEQEK